MGIIKGRRSIVSPELWAEVQVKFEHGVPVRELAELTGLKVSSICSYARRHGWGSHGSSRDSAIEHAKKTAETEMREKYTEIVKEVNERHLEVFRKLQEVNRILLDDLGDRLEWALDEWMRLKDIAMENGLPAPAPVDTGHEAAVLLKLGQAIKMATFAEREILGIQGGILVHRPDEGLEALVEVLRVARDEYFEELLEEAA